ncbi:MAG: hypothetical protein LC781_14100 [Actinobacteria bacterium]|nr:hypothetical protein [Actinomycetota bacterium]
MNKRKPIKKQHEQAVVTDFLGWYNSISGTKFVVVAEPDPPEAVARYEDKHIWLEVADVFWVVAQPTLFKLVNVLSDKLAKASYKPFYESYGPGILLLAVHNPWFDEQTITTMRSQCSAVNWSDNLKLFGKVFIAFFSSEGRTFYEWRAI